METYRDMATVLARSRPEPYVGVVYYAELPHARLASRWNVQTFPRESALREWYEEIAPSVAWYHYLAAFDKTRSSVPVGESTAPPKPGQSGFDVRRTWRHPPYGSTATGAELPGGGKAAAFAKTVGLFALVALPLGLLISRSKARTQTEAEKAEFRRLGWDWDQRVR